MKICLKCKINNECVDVNVAIAGEKTEIHKIVKNTKTSMGREIFEIKSVRESDQNRPAKKAKDEISEKELSNKMEVDWTKNEKHE